MTPGEWDDEPLLPPWQPPPAPGCVYFILSTCCDAVKIGYTSHGPDTRLEALQTAHPKPLVLLAWFEYRDFTEARAAEHQTHERVAKHRLLREWFAPSPSVLESMLSLRRLARREKRRHRITREGRDFIECMRRREVLTTDDGRIEIEFTNED